MLNEFVLLHVILFVRCVAEQIHLTYHISVFLHCSDTVGWVTGRTSGCWFAGGDDLTGALHILYLQLSSAHPSSLAPIKSRMETRSTWKMAVKMNRESHILLSVLADECWRPVLSLCFLSTWSSFSITAALLTVAVALSSANKSAWSTQLASSTSRSAQELSCTTPSPPTSVCQNWHFADDWSVSAVDVAVGKLHGAMLNCSVCVKS